MHFLGRCEGSVLEKGETASVINSFRVNLGIRLGTGARGGSEIILLSKGKPFESCMSEASICMGGGLVDESAQLLSCAGVIRR